MRKTLAFGTLTVAFLSLAVDRSIAGQSAADVPRDPAAVGHLNLHKRHPDANEGPAEFDGYNVYSAVQRLDQMRTFLESFNRMTELSRSRLDPSELKAIGNTSGETQTIGFHNIPLLIEGTLLKQEYQLRQARYQLAQVQLAQRQIGADDLERARAAYRAATRELQRFWDTKLPTD